MPCGGIFDLARKEARLRELDARSAAPELWSKPELAQEMLKERATLQKALDGWYGCQRQHGDLVALLELATEEDDEATLHETAREGGLLDERIRQIEFLHMMSGEADANSCFVQINSGEGGTDAKDWAEMLLRMYARYAERHGYEADVVDYLPGEEAGISSATIHVIGEYAFGHLKAENGVHRLVRISPFDGNARRQTSFASVYVWPEVDDTIVVDLKEEDIRVDTFRASGAGGQHVNKTDSAIRMTHYPTGIVVQCQNERSQHKNRSTALKMLRAKLYELELKRRQEEADAVHAAKQTIGFGSQIRSYVIHPYRLVKDLRTGVEVGDTDSVLDGKLDPFIEAYLLAQAGVASGPAAPAGQ
jgi:peptide chain release factor 2